LNAFILENQNLSKSWVSNGRHSRVGYQSGYHNPWYASILVVRTGMITRKGEKGFGGGEEITAQPWWLTQRKSPFFHFAIGCFLKGYAQMDRKGW
jgi:hypothetical protein